MFGKTFINKKILIYGLGLSGNSCLEYLCKKNVDADKAVKELYLFGGSASDHSSIYYKYS